MKTMALSSTTAASVCWAVSLAATAPASPSDWPLTIISASTSWLLSGDSSSSRSRLACWPSAGYQVLSSTIACERCRQLRSLSTLSNTTSKELLPPAHWSASPLHTATSMTSSSSSLSPWAALDSPQRRCWRLQHTSLAPRSRCGTLQSSPRSGPAKSSCTPLVSCLLASPTALSRVTTLESSLQSRLDRALPDVLVPASVLPRTASEFVAHFRAQPPCSIQHAATHRINTQIFNARMAEAVAARRVEDAARLASLRLARHSSLWLQTLPVEPSLALGDLQWQWAARLRLGMDVPVVDDSCPACKSTTAYTDNSWHALSCVALSGTDITRRHNRVGEPAGGLLPPHALLHHRRAPRRL